jgi:lipopolysaccharide export LptBFGC system permease protein LptF
MAAQGLNEKIEKLLRQAYMARENMEVDARWERELMERVRKIGPLRPEAPFLPAFEEFVWRLAPVFCMLVFVLFAVFIGTEIASHEDPIQLFLSGAEESMLAQLFG